MKFKLIIILIILIASQFVRAEVMISVDRNPVVSDEAFKLVFETDHKHDGEPDFSPLEQYFTILSSGRRSNTQIVNGDITRSQQWILTVMAKQTGVLPIPSIRFGSDVSQATSIEVLKSASSLGANNSDDVIIKSEVDTNTPYVQAQILYTAKVYRSVQTNNAKLFDPVVSGGQAIINRLGNDKTYEKRLNGKPYVVTERQFVIFPQSSGKLKIEPIMFQAQIGTNNFFNFDPFGAQPKSVVKQSESIELDIKPIPDSFTGDTWLPAKQLAVQEQWSVDPAKLKQGEATTRTLTLSTIGLPASNLPEVKIKLPTKLKQYPDQPEFSETTDKNGFISLRHDKMAIIPIEAGNYVLPAIKIPWWNTELDKMEFAELPERTIHVEVSNALPAKSIQQSIVEDNPVLAEKEADQKNIIISQPIENQTPWKIISFILFLLWLVTLFLFWKKKSDATIVDDKSKNELSRRQYLNQLKKAASINNATMAKRALLDWAKTVWPDEMITNIDAIKSYCSDELKIKIDELNNCLYGKDKKQWNGAGFMTVFESQSFNEKITKEEKGKLEPLYKT